MEVSVLATVITQTGSVVPQDYTTNSQIQWSYTNIFNLTNTINDTMKWFGDTILMYFPLKQEVRVGYIKGFSKIAFILHYFTTKQYLTACSKEKCNDKQCFATCYC